MKEESPSERREHAWLPLDQALLKASHEQSKDRLSEADRAIAATLPASKWSRLRGYFARLLSRDAVHDHG